MVSTRLPLMCIGSARGTAAPVQPPSRSQQYPIPTALGPRRINRRPGHGFHTPHSQLGMAGQVANRLSVAPEPVDVRMESQAQLALRRRSVSAGSWTARATAHCRGREIFPQTGEVGCCELLLRGGAHFLDV